VNLPCNLGPWGDNGRKEKDEGWGGAGAVRATSTCYVSIENVSTMVLITGEKSLSGLVPHYDWVYGSQFERCSGPRWLLGVRNRSDSTLDMLCH
jgi:hypothetical protein